MISRGENIQERDQHDTTVYADLQLNRKCVVQDVHHVDIDLHSQSLYWSASLSRIKEREEK